MPGVEHVTKPQTVLTAGVAALLTLTACGGGTPGPPEPRGDAGTSVTVVRLDDGTRCAVIDKPGNGGAAIDCDWDTP